MTEAITFHNIYYKVQEKEIIKGVSGNFIKGAITTLVGPSGSGKTTVLKLCNGLIAATEGEIYIGDELITAIPSTILRKKVGIVLQSAPVIQGTVFDNLQLPRQLQKKQLSKKEALHFLADVHLPESLLQQDASKLSGGQRQKLAIARTLINEPSILLLDEITSALDPTSTREIEQLIVSIQQKYQTTIIWITHNMIQAQRLSDFTWFLRNGKLLREGKTSDLLNESSPIATQLLYGGTQ